MITYYAAVLDGVVYGVGCTRRRAVRDARYWHGCGMPKNPIFYVVPCTQGAFRELMRHGYTKRIIVRYRGAMPVKVSFLKTESA